MQTNNKLREALENLVDLVDAWKDHLPSAIREGEVSNALDKAEAALAEPVRNCEVGTDNEQISRWKEFCDRYEVDRSPESFARWAQGPYFEEGGAE